MFFFQTFAFSRRGALVLRKAGKNKSKPRIESLEKRCLLDCTSISGYVYNDVNRNGIRDAGETPIANSRIELHDAQNHLIAATTTDASGFYSFLTDPRVNTAPATQTYQATFSSQPTDWMASHTVPQFNPALGTLTEVDIIATDRLSSQIRVENLDTAPATIHAMVQGTNTVTGPGLDPLTTNFSADRSFDAAAFDGTVDFGGTSGMTFDPATSSHSNTRALSTPAALAAFTGSGTITFSESAHATSSATGSANLVLSVNTTASAGVQVVYHYIPQDCLPAGDYLIVQPTDPAGFLPGLKTSGNVMPIPNSVTTNTIHVTLGSTSATDNNFGELKPSSLAGFVYHDRNDNGVREAGEEGIANVAITLMGVDDLGNAVDQAQTTAADGSYKFINLRPGTYSITETQPADYLDGRDTIGTPGGQSTMKNQFAHITLDQGVDGANNNFGELKPVTLSGFVYLDPDNNGIKEPGETGIGGVKITLTGIDDFGNPITIATTTAQDGSYLFSGLRPGTYTITEAHPDGYIDGIDTIGSQGGKTAPLQFTDIVGTSGLVGTDNDFAELLPANHVAPTPQPTPSAVVPILGKRYFMGLRSLHWPG